MRRKSIPCLLGLHSWRKLFARRAETHHSKFNPLWIMTSQCKRHSCKKRKEKFYLTNLKP